MSRLYLSESGNVISTLGEEVTTFRRARKFLKLPKTGEQATLYILAVPHAGSRYPLRLAVNGAEVQRISPDDGGIRHTWWEKPIDPALLTAGDNVFEFWADSTAMNAWSLAMEVGVRNPRSYVSQDSGKTWRNEKMGYVNIVPAEYVVRVRLAEGRDPKPPCVVWEDPDHPRAESLRKVLPKEAIEEGPLMKRVRALSAWLASSWEHTSSRHALQYAPWDAETILAWGKTKAGHSGHRPIVMCVHYAVALVSACQALGIPARCAILKGTPRGADGHFVGEVWFDEYQKWVMVDANADAVVFRDGVPLSISEIQEVGSDLKGLIRWGPGTEYQRSIPHIADFVRDNLERGVCFTHRSVWPRADFLSHPELTPVGHGSTLYGESDLVWEEDDVEHGFGMFRYFADAEYFDAPPRLS